MLKRRDYISREFVASEKETENGLNHVHQGKGTRSLGKGISEGFPTGGGPDWNWALMGREDLVKL